jgi:hypothetical protein
MIWTEINAKGNFDTWPDARLKELKEANYSDSVGEVLFENNEIMLWEINLAPFERLPFWRHINNYSCTCISEGLALTRNVNGRISLIRMKKGDYLYANCLGNELIRDLENIGDTNIKVAIVEEKLKPPPAIHKNS